MREELSPNLPDCISSSEQSKPQVLYVPILQMRKLRLREMAHLPRIAQ